MKKINGKSMADIREKLTNGDYEEILIDFDITADDFFSLLDDYYQQGTRIKKVGHRFLVKNVNLITKKTREAEKMSNRSGLT